MGRVGLQIELRGESRTGFSRSPIYILKISDCSEENSFRGTKWVWRDPERCRGLSGKVLGGGDGVNDMIGETEETGLRLRS